MVASQNSFSDCCDQDSLSVAVSGNLGNLTFFILLLNHLDASLRVRLIREGRAVTTARLVEGCSFQSDG